MSITALDIQQQGFEHARRGYDVEQVDVFLERVAQEVDAMNIQIDDLKAAVEAAPKINIDEIEQLKAELAEAKAIAAEAQEAAAVAEEKAAAAEARAAKAEEELNKKDDMSGAIANAFIAAQHAADALKEEARVEAEKLYRDKEAEARNIVRDALAEKQAVIAETAKLKESCASFRDEYHALLERFTNEAKSKFDAIEAAAEKIAAPEPAEEPAEAEAPAAEEEFVAPAEPASATADDDILEEID